MGGCGRMEAPAWAGAGDGGRPAGTATGSIPTEAGFAGAGGTPSSVSCRDPAPAGADCTGCGVGALAARGSFWAAALAGHKPLGTAPCAGGAEARGAASGNLGEGKRDTPASRFWAGTDDVPGAGGKGVGWKSASWPVDPACGEEDDPGFGFSATACSRPFSITEKSRAGDSVASKEEEEKEEEEESSGGAKLRSVSGGAAGNTGAATTAPSCGLVGSGLPEAGGVARNARETFRAPRRGAADAVSGASRTRGEPGAETFTRETDADEKPKGGIPLFNWLAEGGMRQKSAARRGSTGSWRLALPSSSARRRELLAPYGADGVRRDSCTALRRS